MTTPHSEGTEVQRIPLDLIDASPFNVRQEIDVNSLTRSIDSVGQIVPLRLRPVGDRYQVRTGRRKYFALKQAGATHADAIVVEGTDEEVINEQWAENEERADYTDYERALKLQQLMDVRGLSQRTLAKEIGKSPAYVSQFLGILKLEEVFTMVNAPGVLSALNERQARAILQAPEEDWPALVQYVELYLEERGKIPPASTLEDYALQLEQAREIEAGRRRFLYEIEEGVDILPYPEEAADAEPETEAEYAEAAKEYIEEHDLGWVFDAEASGANYLTKIGMLSDEDLGFCLAHETRPLSIQRLNEESYRRDLAGYELPKDRPLLKQLPTADPGFVATINRNVGEPVEEIVAKLVEESGLTEEEADAALQSYRETYPDIWSVCYPEKGEEPEPMTVEQYVDDVLMHSPEVEPAELVRVTAEMFGVSEAYVRGLIDRKGQKRGRKPRDPYAARTLCPLCGRGNAEKNRLLLVLEEYQATQPGITLVDWLREVLA